MWLDVGDIVEVIQSGAGVSPLNIGRRTTITAINGAYRGETDAVQTKDFKNQGYAGWISMRSFKLIKKAKKIRFKAGDKVEVVNCAEIRQYEAWEEALGRIYTLDEDSVRDLNNRLEVILGGNEFGINFTARMLEKF